MSEVKEVPKVVLDLRKTFGESAIMPIGEAPNMEMDSISTGSISLDRAIGVGGIPRGRITEIFGPEGSGKTTLCQHIVSNAQKDGLLCAYIDMEHALDPSYAAKCGVDTDNLLLSQAECFSLDHSLLPWHLQIHYIYLFQ